MLTGKQRASLRAMANSLQPIFQIGKGNLNENLIKSVKEALEAREMVKITILETAEIAPREAMEVLLQATGAEPVQCIGRKLVLYLPSGEHCFYEF